MGHAHPWLRRHWLHGVSPEVEASIDGRLIKVVRLNCKAAFGRPFVRRFMGLSKANRCHPWAA
jgi:hypothetical protein